MLQGPNKVDTQYYDSIQAFKSKLSLLEVQPSNNNPAHFPCLEYLCNVGSAENMGQYKENISNLLQQLVFPSI